MAALALVPALFLAIQASAAEPAGCDPSRPGVTHGADAGSPTPAGVVPCITYGFMGFGEGNVAVSPEGDVMYGGAFDPTPQGDCVVGAYQISSNIGRSTDKGGSWDFVDLRPTDSPPPPKPYFEGPPFGPIPEGCLDENGDLPQSRGSGDPRLLVDPVTDRIWFTNIGNSVARQDFPSLDATFGLCQTEISYSDDGGATWTNDPDPVGFFCPLFDFPHLFTAPRTTSLPVPPGAYPNAVYICKSFPLPIPGIPSAACWKTVDHGPDFPAGPTWPGGAGLFKDFGFPGSLFQDTPELRRATGGLDGTLYGVVSGVLRFSTDEGASWADNGGIIPVTGRGVAVDSVGNVYSAGLVDGLPHVTYSTDRGATWSAPVAVQAPGVGHAHDVSIAVPATGPPGPLALVYVGSDAAADTQFTNFANSSPFIPVNVRADGEHNGYLMTTNDIFSANPVFQSVQVDPSGDEALLPYGFPVTGNTTTAVRGDYIGVTIDEGPAEQIGDILEFFDQSAAEGDLVGKGPGNSAAGRMKALRNKLEAASERIGGGAPWGYFYKDVCPDNPGVVNQTPATCVSPIPGVSDENPHPMWTNWLGAVATVNRGECGQLRSALRKTDGNPRPPDFVQGPAAPELAAKIGALIDRECGQRARRG